MNGERRLERLLRRETDTYRLAADGFERILARMRSRRRQRAAWRAGAGALAVAVVAGGVVVATTGGHHPNGRPTSVAVGGGRPPSSTEARPTGVLVSVTRERVEWISPTDGHVLRALTLAHRLPSRPVGQVAATLSGVTVYVTVDGPDQGCSSRIVAVDTVTDTERTVANDASAPAVNPSGTELAYLSGSGPGCTPTTVTVQQLLAGPHARRSWRISPPAKPHHAGQQLLSLSWAPTGSDLLIGSQFGPSYGIQVLDTAKAVGLRNPATVGPESDGRGSPGGRFSYPVEEADGRIVAYAPVCWGDMSCANPVSSSQSIVTIAPASGKTTTRSIATRQAVEGLVLGPTGDNVLAEVSGNGRSYRLLLLGRHGTTTIATASGPVAWVAGSAPSPPTTAAPPTTQAAHVVATLHLSSHVITAGGKLRATITVDNRTGHTLRDSGCGTLFSVALGNAAHPNSPAEPTCLQFYTIPSGRSTYHVPVLTHFASCEMHGYPRCGRTGTPPLPPGTYQARVYEQGHAVPVPAAQNVRVRGR